MTAPAPATDEVLRASVSGEGARRRVTLDPRFQGLPDTAHGGSVLALFDAIASVPRSRRLLGSYRRRVPLGTALALSVEDDDAVSHFQLSEGVTVLVEGSVAAASRDGATNAPPPAPLRDAGPLPVSKTCFACGRDNALGLRVALAIDDQHVGGVWVPHETLRAADGGLAPVAVTTLLDETAFWLGAAASGEAGMTTDLRLLLHAPVAFGRLTVAGSRASVRMRADDARYWETEVAAWDDGGALVASAAITFVAVRGAARKLVAGLLAINPPEVLRRVFPAYAG